MQSRRIRCAPLFTLYSTSRDEVRRAIVAEKPTIYDLTHYFDWTYSDKAFLDHGPNPTLNRADFCALIHGYYYDGTVVCHAKQVAVVQLGVLSEAHQSPHGSGTSDVVLQQVPDDHLIERLLAYRIGLIHIHRKLKVL
jgi:hypothetical protein